jgi:hypothetical protein
VLEIAIDAARPGEVLDVVGVGECEAPEASEVSLK